MSVHKISEYLLTNGFKLIVKEDHRSPIAIFQMVYKVGSVNEYDGITGISHALEHMMFRGSRHYSATQFLDRISEMGAKQNAFTTHDYTAYYEVFNLNEVDFIFKFEADRMQNLLLRESDFAKEMEIIKEERRLSIEDDPHRQVLERFFATAFLSSAYHHPIIGWMDDLKNMSLDNLKNWYKTWYVPNNAIGVIVGDIEPKKMYQLAKKHFGLIKSSVLPEIKPQREVPPLGCRTVDIKLPAKVPWIAMGYNVPVVNTAEEKWEPYALLVLCEILAGSHSARLQQNIIRDKRLIAEVNYHYSPFGCFDDVVIFTATPTSQHTLEEAREGILKEIQQLQNQVPHLKELKRVKIQYIAQKVYEEDSISNQAREIGNFEAVGLSWRDLDKVYKEIAAITPEQIKTVARKYLVPERLILVNLRPLPISQKNSKQKVIV